VPGSREYPGPGYLVGTRVYPEAGRIPGTRVQGCTWDLDEVVGFRARGSCDCQAPSWVGKGGNLYLKACGRLLLSAVPLLFQSSAVPKKRVSVPRRRGGVLDRRSQICAHVLPNMAPGAPGIEPG
jgi:hypothetical protein